MPSAITIILSTVYFGHLINASTVTYSEVQHFGGSCYPRDSCSGGRTEELDNLWDNYTCECGRQCSYSGTCCVDSPFLSTTQKNSHLSTEKCQKVKLTSRYVLMVSSCSRRWQKKSPTYEKCEKEEDVLNDPMSKLPITSIQTGISYKNYFCAVCNFDSNHVVFWNIAVTGTQNRSHLQDNFQFNSEQNAWGTVGAQGTFQRLELNFVVPESLYKLVKPCYPGIISQCPPPIRNSDLQRKCRLYYAPIKIMSGGKFKMYRNVHCALCNNKDSNLEVACPLSKRRKTQHPLSFALLLDVNQKDGEKVGQTRACSKDQVYDPFFKKCRSMKCAIPGYVIKNGSCAKDVA
ncbi:uncharacterized protein LOC129227450 [Uloborus diversus]|uniref:uncharacterized protein LOC129227450 n=1 Tax=Uloborus diversus TaxID=327109 RepID=UPI002409F7B7|nr:uncharacterized protein LOC129227450 [Uloborus diversus]XP_054717986.1 uncharacterized protein LOC129227450 [Uloborus diversus]